MTPEALAALSARAYTHMAPWTAAQFRDALALPRTLLVSAPQGFVLGQVIGDEAEILALATEPDHQRQGTARALLAAFHGKAADRGAIRAVLEVAEANRPARALYKAAGYVAEGRRKGYYRQVGSDSADALIMARALP